MLMGRHSNAATESQVFHWSRCVAWNDSANSAGSGWGGKVPEGWRDWMQVQNSVINFPIGSLVTPLTERRVTQTFPRLFCFVSRPQSLCADLLHSTKLFLIPTCLVNEAREATTWKTGLNQKCTLGMKMFFYKDNVSHFFSHGLKNKIEWDR